MRRRCPARTETRDHGRARDRKWRGLVPDRFAHWRNRPETGPVRPCIRCATAASPVRKPVCKREGIGRRLAHRNKFAAAHKAPQPQAEIDRQSVSDIVDTRCKFARAGESSGRFDRAMASRCDQRVAIGELKIDLSLAKRSGVPHFIRFREHRQQRLRFGDLRHFRGRRKAHLSAGTRTPWASTSSAVDWSRAWPATAPRAVRSCGLFGPVRWRWR